MQFFRVKNFYKYQGDKRWDAEKKSVTWSANWAKIHHEILKDFEFAKLSPTNRYIFIGMILLASETRNIVEADPEYLKFRLHLDEPPDLETFSHFIEESDGKTSIIEEERPKKRSRG